MDTFYASLPSLTAFEGIVDRAFYRPLPDDWVIGLADVEASTAAVREGRYKAVNLAGIAVISALANSKKTLDFPYVFSGDGMVCAVPGRERPLLEETLAAAIGWVGSALDLSLRGAVVSVEDIRAAGHDVRIARFTPTTNVAYAMFAGGGIAWAEAELKGGRLPGLNTMATRPDLSGLSCRFKPIPSRRGVMLSLIVVPAQAPADEAFRLLVGDLLRMTADAHPLPSGGPRWAWPPAGLTLEARLQHKPGRRMLVERAHLAVRTLVAAIVVNLGLRVGGFVPSRYRAELVQNSDFRKFGDGLMMTVDCSPETADAIEGRLLAACEDGVAVFGTHRQGAALMTCLVPSPNHPGHIHFIDGANGGYTLAAQQLKARRGERAARVSTINKGEAALAGTLP